MKFYNAIFAIIIWLSLTLLAIAFADNILGQSQDVSVSVIADKNSIYLGEIISLEFEFHNARENAVQIPTGGVMSGNIRIFIAKKGAEYRIYNTSGWGRSSEKVVTLSPNQSYKADNTNATILWNGKPDYSHLNTDAAKEADKFDNRILTDYAFPEAGTYLIKAVSCLIDGIKGCSIPIESKPLQITVVEPIGEDLEVWKKLKNNPKFGLFLQTNGNSLREEDKLVIDEIKSLVETYPNSRYAQPLQQSLEKFKASEAKRQEYLQQMQNKKEKNQ